MTTNAKVLILKTTEEGSVCVGEIGLEGSKPVILIQQPGNEILMTYILQMITDEKLSLEDLPSRYNGSYLRAQFVPASEVEAGGPGSGRHKDFSEAVRDAHTFAKDNEHTSEWAVAATKAGLDWDERDFIARKRIANVAGIYSNEYKVPEEEFAEFAKQEAIGSSNRRLSKYINAESETEEPEVDAEEFHNDRGEWKPGKPDNEQEDHADGTPPYGTGPKMGTSNPIEGSEELESGGPGSGRHKEVYYHGTTSNHLSSILQKGLVANSHSAADQAFLDHFAFTGTSTLSGKISVAGKETAQWYAQAKAKVANADLDSLVELPVKPMSEEEKQTFKKFNLDPDKSGKSFIKSEDDGLVDKNVKPILLAVKVPSDASKDPEEPAGRLVDNIDPEDIVGVHEYDGSKWNDVTTEHLKSMKAGGPGSGWTTENGHVKLTLEKFSAPSTENRIGKFGEKFALELNKHFKNIPENMRLASGASINVRIIERPNNIPKSAKAHFQEIGGGSKSGYMYVYPKKGDDPTEVAGTAIHEYGHAVDKYVGVSNAMSNLSDHKDFKEVLDKDISNLSDIDKHMRYAYVISNAREAFAETFAHLANAPGRYEANDIYLKKFPNTANWIKDVLQLHDKKDVQAGGPGSGRHPDFGHIPFNEDGSVNTTVKKDPEHEFNGHWHVLIGNHHHLIYRDPESKIWYESPETGGGKHFTELYVGLTKKEAINSLVLKHIANRDLSAGGPGSGRHPWGRKERPQHARTVVLTIKMERAMKNFKIADMHVQSKAEANENALATALGGKSYNDTEPLDIVVRNNNRLIGLEVKTLLTQTNNKITMNHGAIPRKEHWQKKTSGEIYTVAIDNRGGKNDIYIKRGVGSFNIGAMTKVGTSFQALAKHLNIDPKKSESLPIKFPKTRQAFGLDKGHRWARAPKGL